MDLVGNINICLIFIPDWIYIWMDYGFVVRNIEPTCSFALGIGEYTKDIFNINERKFAMANFVDWSCSLGVKSGGCFRIL